MIIYGTSGAGKTYIIAQAVSSIKVNVTGSLVESEVVGFFVFSQYIFILG